MQVININDPQATSAALSMLNAGELVICPTETVYGLLADATNPTAIDRLLAYKRRPAGKAVSIAVADRDMAGHYVTLSPQADDLYRTLLPGPVTVVSPSRHLADPRLESEFGTLGIRWPAYPFLTDLIACFGRAVTATSANSSGRKTPYSLADITAHTSTRQQSLVSLALDAGTLPTRPPSLIIDTTTSTPIVMRKNANYQQFSATQQTFITHCAPETADLAGKIILPHLDDIWQTGLLVTLDGDLGAGKTTFTAGLGRFLGVPQIINSPTYTYLKQYNFTKFNQKGSLAHLDVWTLDRPEMLTALDLPSLFRPGVIVIIEWFHQIEPFFSCPLPRLSIEIISDPQEPDIRTLFMHDFTKNTANKE